MGQLVRNRAEQTMTDSTRVSCSASQWDAHMKCFVLCVDLLTNLDKSASQKDKARSEARTHRLSQRGVYAVGGGGEGVGLYIPTIKLCFHIEAQRFY